MEQTSIWKDVAAPMSNSFNAMSNDSHFTPQSNRTQSRWPPFSSSPGWNIGDNNLKNNQSNGSITKAFNSSSSKFEASSEPPTSHVSAQDVTAHDFALRYKQLKNLETIKNELIEELLYRYDCLNEQYRKLSDDHDRESEYNRSSQRREKSLQDNIRRLQYHLDRDPFVLILIDGDSVIFNDQFLKRGEAGGREAASLLNVQIFNRVESTFPVIQSEVRVVTRVYANIGALAETCFKAGLVDRPSQVEEFARGFTNGQNLFDFIDVGTDKGRTDAKISELLKLHLHDYHCRHIFFAGSQENGYSRVLEDIGSSQYVYDRVTLIESVQSGQEPYSLDLKTTKCEGLFRETKLDKKPQDAENSKVNTSQFVGVALPLSTAPKSGINQQLSDVEIIAVKDFMPNLPLAKAASISTGSSAKQSPTSTWASAVAKTAVNIKPPTPTPTPTPVASKDQQIPRNRKGQRVDPVIKHDKVEVDRVKKLKMCNVHFLRGECPYGNSCSHVHQYNPGVAELQTLRLVARMAPCMHGSDCDDIKCIYGHVCPAPEGREGKDCIFGEQCRFPAELHKIDRQVVKIIKV